MGRVWKGLAEEEADPTEERARGDGNMRPGEDARLTVKKKGVAAGKRTPGVSLRPVQTSTNGLAASFPLRRIQRYGPGHAPGHAPCHPIAPPEWAATGGLPSPGARPVRDVRD